MALPLRQIQRYGWRKDQPDHRDLLFAPPPQVALNLPSRVDWRAQDSPRYDQGQLGSCTGNAIAGMVQFVRRKEKVSPDFVPSRLFIYLGERQIEGTVHSDSGAELRDGMKALAACGVPPETQWPYDIPKFTDTPPASVYQAALPHRAIQYLSLLQNLNTMKSCLASGFPFVFGFNVFPAFEGEAVAATGHVALPGANENFIGGHAVMGIGYDDTANTSNGDKGYFIVRNSWGAQWGISGYFTLPYAYITDPRLASDFWTLRLVQ